ncbi:hypothetical protein AOQ84DRAFT_438211 [Glonium stellatum]|uniref:Uncharacterized protein n=1 Tax=Glonium stellatum TaxID=574774 RepID=A0A8E2F4Z0_9PEZI|nr:hypothetical protein AOQ84DRAFT_438211 [Glonium stellatum]
MACASEPPRLPFPLEIFLQILDEVVKSASGVVPVAYPPSNSVVRTFKSLMLVCKSLSATAAQYLYSHCLYINSESRLHKLLRTLGNGHGQLEQSPWLAGIEQYMTSACLSIRGYNKKDSERTSATIELFNFIGPSLKRLILTGDFNNPRPGEDNPNDILSQLHNLEELQCSYDAWNYCKHATLPQLKRLAFDFAGLGQDEFSFLQRSPKLEVLVTFRQGLSASCIDHIFESYRGSDLKVLVVDVANNHRPLPLTRDWAPQDKVHIMEVDVPVSYYGDEREYNLCQMWIRNKAIQGTLWEEHSRPMELWTAYIARWGN